MASATFGGGGGVEFKAYSDTNLSQGHKIHKLDAFTPNQSRGVGGIGATVLSSTPSIIKQIHVKLSARWIRVNAGLTIVLYTGSGTFTTAGYVGEASLSNDTGLSNGQSSGEFMIYCNIPASTEVRLLLLSDFWTTGTTDYSTTASYAQITYLG